MAPLFYIFIGGGAGSVMRFWISASTQKLWNIGSFPLGTFIVNVVGCLLIGLFSASVTRNNDELRYLLLTGFCGGFTTFSTFSSENFTLLQNGNIAVMVLYISLSIILGLAAVWAGFLLVKN